MSFHAEQDRSHFESGIGFNSVLNNINQDIWLKSKHQSSANLSIYIDRSLSVRSQLYSDQFPTFEEMEMRRSLFDQVEQAFTAEPSIDGVLRGRREIKLGKRWGGRASYFPSKKNAKSGLPAVAIPVESRVEPTQKPSGSFASKVGSHSGIEICRARKGTSQIGRT